MLKHEPLVITLCGSYKFKDTIMEYYRRLTDQGNIVLLPAIDCCGMKKQDYMELHFKKIQMSDVVFIINPGGYIGESVKEEIEVAKKYSKPIKYLV